jgi:hypothetical protein
MTDTVTPVSCHDCQFYRSPDLVPAALERALTRPRDQSSVMGEIRKSHADQRAAEFEQWVELSFSEVEDARWEARPAASPYCGKFERRNPPLHFLAEVRNAKRNCSDHSEGPLLVRSCGACRHSVPPTGEAEDEREIEVTVRLGLIGDQSAYREVVQRVTANQGQEVQTAYQNDGYLGLPPRYLEYCAHTAPEAPGPMVCAVKNPDQRCPHWEAPPSSDDQSREGDPS